jgi:hypothetical protein
MGHLLAPGDPLDALDLLSIMGVTITLDRPRGQLHVRPRPVPALAAELIRASRALLHAVLYGAYTEHVWARCDKCGEGLMRKKGAKPKRCVFTPGCKGSHR